MRVDCRSRVAASAEFIAVTPPLLGLPPTEGAARTPFSPSAAASLEAAAASRPSVFTDSSIAKSSPKPANVNYGDYRGSGRGLSLIFGGRRRHRPPEAQSVDNRRVRASP